MVDSHRNYDDILSWDQTVPGDGLEPQGSKASAGHRALAHHHQ